MPGPDVSDNMNALDIIRELFDMHRENLDAIVAPVRKLATLRGASEVNVRRFTISANTPVPILLEDRSRTLARIKVSLNTNEVFIGPLNALPAMGYPVNQTEQQINTTDNVYIVYAPTGAAVACEVFVWIERTPD